MNAQNFERKNETHFWKDISKRELEVDNITIYAFLLVFLTPRELGIDRLAGVKNKMYIRSKHFCNKTTQFTEIRRLP